MKSPKLLPFLLLPIISYCQSSDNVTEYKRNGFAVKHPAKLGMEEAGKNGSEFFLIQEQTTKFHDFSDNIELITQNLDSLGFHFDAFVSLSKTQIKSEGFFYEIQKHYNNLIEYHGMVYKGKSKNLYHTFLRYNFKIKHIYTFRTNTFKSDEYDLHS